jgi:predicted AAA+ superfamily ATPase
MAADMYIKRAVESTVLKTSQAFPVVLLTGPRQVGKTTMLQKLAEPERHYVSLDDPDVRMLAKTDPAAFMQRFTPPVIIDEIQYAPELLPYVKMSVDSSRLKGTFWLTGSQTFQAMKNVSESLAGRVGIIELLGLSDSEINGVASEPFIPDQEHLTRRLHTAKKMTLKQTFERIFKGSMPALHSFDVDIETYYKSYLATYLQRDIRDLTQVADEMAFLKFMTVVAARTAKPIVYEEIANEVGISSPTAKKWLSVLVSSNIIAMTQPYSNNVLKRVTKMPLIHFLDTGLCAYLLKWGNAEILERGAMAGSFFESYVFSEIYKSWLNAGRVPPIYYYRDKDKREIDLLILQNGILYPIEIKKTASPGADSIKSFGVLKSLEYPEKFGEMTQLKIAIGTGAVICMANDLLPIDKKNWCVPSWLI